MYRTKKEKKENRKLQFTIIPVTRNSVKKITRIGNDSSRRLRKRVERPKHLNISRNPEIRNKRNS